MKELITFVLMLILQNIACNFYSPRAYRMPQHCKHESYCLETGEYYPNNTVTGVLRKALNNHRWSGVINHLSNTIICDNLKEDPSQLTECNTTYICDARVYYVKDEHNKTRVVIQSDQQGFEFKQLYYISKCSQEGRITKSRNFQEQLLKGFTVSCETKYSDYYFLVLSKNYSNVELIKAYLPVFCKCTMKRNWA